MDTFDQKMILNADSFLKSYGIISDYHKNNIIVSCLCICRFAKNLKLLINSDENTITVIFLVSRFSYYFKSKTQTIKQVSCFMSEYMPKYSVSVKFELV